MIHAITNPMSSTQPNRTSLLGVDFFVGLAISLVAAWIALGHFRSAYDLTIKDRLTQCEQPLNNRCDYVYRVREATGEERLIDLAGFRPDPVDLAAGNSIKKPGNTFSYFVNGREVQWPKTSLLAGAGVLALVLLGNSLYRFRRATRRG